MKTEKELKSDLKTLKKQFDAETDPEKRSALAAEGERVAAELEALRAPADTTGTVKVRAREPLGEIIDGEMHRFAKGDEFALPAERVKALGPLVEPLN